MKIVVYRLRFKFHVVRSLIENLSKEAFWSLGVRVDVGTMGVYKPQAEGDKPAQLRSPIIT